MFILVSVFSANMCDGEEYGHDDGQQPSIGAKGTHPNVHSNVLVSVFSVIMYDGEALSLLELCESGGS